MALSLPDPQTLLGPVSHAGLASGSDYDGDLATTLRIAAECAKSVWHVTEEEGEAVQLILRIWEATAHAIIKDLEAGRNVALPPLGMFKSRSLLGALGVVANLEFEEEDLSTMPTFVLSDTFALRYGLEYVPDVIGDDKNGPQARFSPVAVARVAEVDKEIVQSALAAIIHRLGETFSQQRLVMVSFAPLGRFICKDRMVKFEALRRRSPHNSGFEQPTVRGMLLTSHKQLQRSLGPSDSTLTPSPPKKGTASPRSLQSSRHSSSPKGLLQLQARQLDVKTTTLDDGTVKEEQPSTADDLLEGSFHRTLPSYDVQYPPLLNECSRTLAVPYTGAQDPGSPSGRIAASYAGAAAWLTSRLPGVNTRKLHWWPDSTDASMPTLPKRIVDYASLFANQLIEDGSPLDIELQDAGVTRSAFYECLHRYNHYVTESVPSSCIAPFNPMWMQNIGALLDVRRFIVELTAPSVDKMLSEMREEVLQDYLQALRKAIVDHIFGDERARQRAGVPFVPCPPVAWGSVPFLGIEGTHGGPPEEWRAGLAESRLRLFDELATCSQSTLQLLELWHRRFDGLLLVDLPARGSSGLVQLDEFKSAQESHRTKVRAQFEDEWLCEVVEILNARRAQALPGHHEPAFYESVAALLSTQARSVVERSIDAYVGFFRRFSKETPMKPSQAVQLSDNDEREDAFLTLGLTAQYGDIRFSSDLEDVAQSLRRIFHDFVVCLHELKRPGNQLGRKGSESPEHLWEVSFDEQHVEMAEKFITDVVKLNLTNAEQALNLYDDYRHLLQEDLRTRELAENLTLTREDYMLEVDKLRATESAIRENCPSQIRLQMISIDCAELNETLCTKASEAVQILLEAVLRNLLLKNDQLVKSFETVVNHMVKKPTSEVELVSLESHVNEFRTAGLCGLLSEFASIRAWLGFLFECEDRLCRAMLSHRHYRAIYESACWVHSIDHTVSLREANLRREREALESKFQEQRSKFVEDLETFNSLVDRFRECGKQGDVEVYLEKIQDLKNKFASAHLEAEKLNSKEERLGWEPSAFEQLRRGELALEPYHRLWTTASNKRDAEYHWLKDPIFSLDPKEVEGKANSMRHEAQQLREIFEDLDQLIPSGVARDLEEKVSTIMKEHLGLVHSLCNQGLRQRHWEQISEIVGFAMERDKRWTLEALNDRDVGKHMHKLHLISEAATKEHAIECALDGMETEWQPVQFDLRTWRSTGTHVISKSCVEEMKGLVDDHLVKTRTMRTSPHVVPWAQRAADWQDWLESTSQILKLWGRLQSAWTYLEPVFSGQDILRQMPTEGQLFRKVDKVWRELMDMTGEKKAALRVTTEEGLQDRLQECCNMLDEVHKGLHDYLEAKRLAFARFFFLSNDELLEILADVQDPDRVQVHLRKCFEGIHGLEFDQTMSESPAARACAMMSAEGEVVPFKATVEWDASEGGAEEWFSEIELAMTLSTRQMCFHALSHRAENPRRKWVQECPSQAVLCVSMVLWTQDATVAIQNSGLEDLCTRAREDFMDLVSLVRGPEVRPLTRKLLEAMIVLDMHHVDVLEKLVDSGVASLDDYEWHVQLRFYIEGRQDEPEEVDAFAAARVELQRDRNFFASMAGADMTYDYEYLGNGTRLVPTPLTDRVHRTICCALHHLYGVALEGRAATGKSETIKDLAKALARMCIVFNCSENLDVDAMGRFFKGSAASGAWCCFDEFDCMSAQVLSVVAQQILTVQQAIVRRLPKFDFEGITLKLRHTFIAVNLLSYGSRAQMPSNLTALFRPAAMMVPDSLTITEAKLLSYGFVEAKALARKIVKIHQMCEDLLSDESHYDNSLRAMLAVLTAAGRYRRTYQEEEDVTLVLWALMEMNTPKLVPSDQEVFAQLLNDTFPQLPHGRPEHTLLKNTFRDCLREHDLQIVGYLETKAMQLYEISLLRHGVLAVGETHTGKTTSIWMLADTITSLADGSPGSEEMPVKIVSLNAHAITLGQLFGCYNGFEDEDWSDGVLTSLVRNLVKERGEGRRYWVHFDGPVDSEWAENINTVLDDSRKLCLLSGETIDIPLEALFLFESQDLQSASPATVSRCGTVFYSAEEMGYTHLIEQYHDTLCPKTFEKEDLEELQAMLDWLLPPLLKCMQTEVCNHVVFMKDHLFVNGALEVLAVLLMPLKDPDCYAHIRLKGMIPHLDACVLLACIWGIGAVAGDEAGRKIFDATLKSLCFDEHPDIKAFKELVPMFPEHSLCFDHAWDDELGQWCGWLDIYSQEQKFKLHTSPLQMVVRTLDTARFTHLAYMSCRAHVPFLFCGPRGSGKTVFMHETLHTLDEAHFQSVKIRLSAQTGANDVQDIVDGFLEKRERDAFGPPAGSTCIIFVDDLSLPLIGKSKTQQPLELLRQFCCFRGWYDLKEQTHVFRRMIDCVMTGTMLTPKDAHSGVSPRLLRHFYVMGVLPIDEESIAEIFCQIVSWQLQENEFPKDLIQHTHRLVGATLVLHNVCCAEFAMTPRTPHYMFSIANIGRVVAGILLLGIEESIDADKHTRLWTHECLRSFSDALVDESDRERLRSFIQAAAREEDVIFDEALLTPAGAPCFTDVLGQVSRLQACKPYDEVEDFMQIEHFIDEDLMEMNHAEDAHLHLDLVMFPYAIMHTLRLCRIMRLGISPALLIGTSGSGRRSLARLAAHLAEHRVTEIGVKPDYSFDSWREDIRTLLRSTCSHYHPQMVIVNDSKVISDKILAEVHSLVSYGELVNFWTWEDKEVLMELVRQSSVRSRSPSVSSSPDQADAESTESKEDEVSPSWAVGYARLAVLVTERLRLVLCASPAGPALRQRLQRFPAFMHRCTIDWFEDWPASGLQCVASRVFPSDTPRASTCSQLCQILQTSVSAMSKRLLEEHSRYYYVTPVSFFALISTFLRVLGATMKNTTAKQTRLTQGIGQIAAMADSLEKAKQSLDELQPHLEAKRREIEELLETVRDETLGAEERQQTVEEDEQLEAEYHEKTWATREDCKNERNAALRMVEDAMASLETLSTGDIAEIKNIKNPSDTVKKVLEVTAVLKGQKIMRFKDDNLWAAAQKMISEANFFQSLQRIDKDRLPSDTIRRANRMMNDADLEPTKVERSSKAIASLHRWVRAMLHYDAMCKKVHPKQQALDAAAAEYREVEIRLAQKRADLAAARDALAKKTALLQAKEAEHADLKTEADECSAKISRAARLISSLQQEQAKWTQQLEHLDAAAQHAEGNAIATAGISTHLGMFPPCLRAETLAQWSGSLTDKGLPLSPGFSLVNFFDDPVKVTSWVATGLPNTSVTLENGVMIAFGCRAPLCIDPEDVANTWIKKMEGGNQLVVLQLSSEHRWVELDTALHFGYPVLVEDVGEEFGAKLNDLLHKYAGVQEGHDDVAGGEDMSTWRIYLTTKLRNPHYLPHVCASTTIVDFTMSSECISDQLLGIIIAEEQPELSLRWSKMNEDLAEQQNKLRVLEGAILAMLSKSAGDILGDEDALNSLSSAVSESTVTSEELSRIMEVETLVDRERADCSSVLQQGSALFSALLKLRSVNPMYCFSLPFFLQQVATSCAEVAQQASSQDGVEEGRGLLMRKILAALYEQVSQCLFAQHRLVFAALLAFTLGHFQHPSSSYYVTEKQIKFLLTGGGDDVTDNSDCSMKPDWMEEQHWSRLLQLGKNLPNFQGIQQEFEKHAEAWQAVYESDEPRSAAFPGAHTTLPEFLRILVFRCLCPAEVIPALVDWSMHALGLATLQPPPFDLLRTYASSSCVTPLIFILSAADHPVEAVLKLSAAMSVNLRTICMGQGQAQHAQAVIEESLTTGEWVLVQNCHLMPKWMPELAKLCDQMSPQTVHGDFRLWLSSCPSPAFPPSILEVGLKMTMEPASGIKASMKRMLAADPFCHAEFYQRCDELGEEWTQFLYMLLFAHAVIVGRRSYGSLGWNCPYEFMDADLQLSVKQLMTFAQEQSGDDLLKLVKYNIVECNYGARITEHADSILLEVLMSECCEPRSPAEPMYELLKACGLDIPEEASHDAFLQSVEALSDSTLPAAYGLHKSAEVSQTQKMGSIFYKDMLDGPCRIQAHNNLEEAAASLASRILQSLPESLDEAAAAQRRGLAEHSSSATIQTETLQYNRLLNMIHASLRNVTDACQGLTHSSAQGDDVAHALSAHRTPASWLTVSYLSAKPLGNYLEDLKRRLEFMQEWIAAGPAPVLWAAGFFSVHPLLLVMLQAFARKYTHSLELLGFSFDFPQEEPSKIAEDGAHVQGFFLEGCCWDGERRELADPHERSLAALGPTIWFQPCLSQGDLESLHFMCPLYVVPSRRETLVRKPYQRNFVISICFPSQRESSYWIRRGAAALLQLES